MKNKQRNNESALTYQIENNMAKSIMSMIH
jgi:hypothetical protein